MQESMALTSYVQDICNLMNLRRAILSDAGIGSTRLPLSNQHHVIQNDRLYIGNAEGVPLEIPSLGQLVFDLSSPVGFIESMAWSDYIITASAVRRRISIGRPEVLSYCDAIWEAGLSFDFLEVFQRQGLQIAMSHVSGHDIVAPALRAMKEAFQYSTLQSPVDRQALSAIWSSRITQMRPDTRKVITKHLIDASMPKKAQKHEPKRRRICVDKSIGMG
jgi:hypothetical protein